MKRRIFTLFLSICILLSAAIPASAMSSLEQEACDLVNAQRQSHGLPPLAVSSQLSDQARVKAQDMKERQYFDHNSPAYGSPFSLMKELGVSYQSAGENIAMGYRTAQAVVSAWMNSPSHRAAILSETYTHMGVGETGGYWALWFIR